MSNYELHNFIEDYPCQNDPDIQWNISRRREFNELTSDSVKLEKVDRFFKHQQLFLRYIRQYDRIFNIQATGTGKSGSIINAAEFFKKYDSNIKRIYVLEPGKQTILDFKNQVKKLSDPEEYIPCRVRDSESGTVSKNSINRLINEWYTIETYGSFAKKNYSDNMIIEEFSNCLFFFDEAHRLKENSDKDDKVTNNIYNFLWRVTHLAKNSKFIVASATPMVNFTDDFVILLNLLLPMDKQLPLHSKLPEKFYNKVTIDSLEPFFRGLITFIKFTENKINVNNMGEPIDHKHNVDYPLKNKDFFIKPTVKKIENGKIITVNEYRQATLEMVTKEIPSQVKLVNLEMLDIQLEVYDQTNKKSRKAFESNMLQISNFVYPDGQFGKDGFKNYVEKNDLNEYVFREYALSKKQKLPGLYGAYFDESKPEESLENLRYMSSKFYFYVKKEIEASKEKYPGNSFCYIKFTEASGAILLGMILKIFGFEEYINNFNAIDPKTNSLNLKKAKRFFLLTGDDSKNNFQNLKIFNHPDNKHGEYIQIIIASETAQVGINVKNVLRGYIMSPEWHESGTYQAVSRFIRADSHDDLYNETGQKAEVEVYRLCATAKNKKSVDTKLYMISENKDIYNKRILRFMKRCAFDAFLNYDRNTMLDSSVNDKDSGADYDKIYYKIYSAKAPPGNDKRKGMALNQGPNHNEYIYNTYNLFYADSNIQKCKDAIIDILQVYNIIKIDNLKKLVTIKNLTDFVFYSTIEYLIFNKESIADKQNINYYNLVFNNDLLYLVRENVSNENKRITTEKEIFYDTEFPILEKKILRSGDNLLENFYDKYGNENLETIKNLYIQTQDYKLFKLLLEDSLIKLRANTTSNINKIIITLFSNYILIINKPINYIKLANEYLVFKGDVKQGRKRAKDSKVGLNRLDLDKIEDIRSKEKVYLHFYKESEDTSYSVNSIFRTLNKNIRILEEENETFRDADIAEEFVYNYFFNIEYEKMMDRFNRSDYYGSMILRGGQGSIMEKSQQFFRIHDNTDPKNRGKVCSNYSIELLTNILKYLDKEKKYKYLLEKKIKKPDLCPKLKDLFNEKELLFTSL